MQIRRTQLYTLVSILLLAAWSYVIVHIFRPYGMNEAQAMLREDLPKLGSLAIEQLGPKLRISYVSYSPTLELSLPGLKSSGGEKRADEYEFPEWFARSFAASPIISPEGSCEWDLPGASFQDQRLSMQVLAFCPLPMDQWKWDLSFLLGPLPYGSLQVILVDNESSESLTLRGRHLLFQTKRIAIAQDDESANDDARF